MTHPDRVEFVQLTGQPRATLGLDVVSFVPDKRFQLLSYLAYHGDWIGRERLAFLFWPDTDSANARQNLRGLVQRLRTLPWAEEIEATRQQIRWLVDSDVARYREALRRGRDDDALEAYSGPLLLGMHSDDAGEYGEWLEIERQQLYAQWRSVALQRVRALGPSRYRAAVGLLRRVLDADPLDEEAVRLSLAAAARAGRPEDGRSTYRAFAARLDDEMGLEPTAETVAAYEALATVPESLAPVEDELPTVPLQVPEAQVEEILLPPARRYSLPTPATTFIGRESELADVTERLRDPTCRLLSIVGSGGVGKTRLALNAAEELRDDFPDGTVFVPLDAVVTHENVPTVLATALGVSLAPDGDPLTQVVRSLRDSHALLVLDNFEQVLLAVPVVLALLEGCPRVKLLVTSREPLHLEAEWLYPLEGFKCPPVREAIASLLTFAAVALFVERARRVRPAFAITSGDAAALTHLCHLTGGMPLAIELAAVWVRALPVHTIVQEVSRNLDLLEFDASDRVPRHRSVRATFEQSWAMLTEGERSAMQRLAVFRSAFLPQSAVFVTGASHAILAALVDKSLLKFRDDGRFDRHPLLLSFTQEKLAADEAVREETERRHRAYYLRFLRERTDRARGPSPAAALLEIDGELPEILAAATLARERQKSADLVAFMRLLAIDTGYLQARGYVPTMIELLEAASEAAIAAGSWVAAQDLMGRLGDAYGTHHGDFSKGLEAYRSAAEFARRSGNTGREAVMESMAGTMRFRIEKGGINAELDRALALANASGDDLCLAAVLEHRGYVLGSMEAWTEANELYRQSLEVVDRLDAERDADPFEINRRRFYGLLNLGETEQHLDRFEAALAAREQAMRIAEESGNQVWSAHAFSELGEMYESIGKRSTANEHLVRAIELYRANHVTAEVDRLTAFMELHGYDVPVEPGPS